MKVKFKHIFPGKILQIHYFGTTDNLKIWIDCEVNQEKKWFIIDLKESSALEIPNPFSKEQIYNWLGCTDWKASFSLIIQGKNPKAESYVTIDLKTGTVFEKTNVFSFQSIANTKTKIEFEIQNPTHYQESNPHFESFREFFLKKFKIEISKGIDYLDSTNKLIFSYYLYENTWVNKLKVCNLSFETEWEDCLDSNELIGHTTFQVVNQFLVYTKNKNEMIILENE